MKGMKSVPTGHKRTSQTNNFLTFARNSVKEQMIDRTVFENKKAAYYTLGCKLNFAETSAIGKTLAEAGGAKLGSIMSASQGVFQITQPLSTEVAYYGMYDTSTVEKDVRCVVNVQFAVGQ